MTLLDEHLAALRRDRYSEATLDARERVLRTIPNLEHPTREQIMDWWEARQTREDGTTRAASSLAQDASHLRAFYRWAMQQDKAERNAADWLPRVRQKKPAPTPVTEADLYRIMQDADTPMKRMLALGSMAGLRSAEIGAVRWGDLDHGNGVLWVREGKGGKDRSVPLSAGLLAELGEPGRPDQHIIGKPMTGKAVSQAISRHMRRLGVDLSAHKLRARYATRFLAATGDLKAAADALGHADLSSISRYVIASSDTMRRGAEAAGRIG